MNRKGNTNNTSNSKNNHNNSYISKNNSRNIPLHNTNTKTNSISKSNISFQKPQLQSKLNTSHMNSQSKILEENFSENFMDENSNEENSNQSDNQSDDDQIDFDIENLNESLRDILENMSENEDDYNAGLEKYYQHLQDKLEKLEMIEKEKIQTKQVSDLQNEILDEQINHLHSMIEQFKAENKKLKNMIKTEKSKNPQLQVQINENNMIVEKIFTAVKYLDVTKLIKFQKHLINRRTSNLEIDEATMALRGTGGEYLKRQASVLYFLHLLKARYKVTKIPQEISKKESDKTSTEKNFIEESLRAPSGSNNSNKFKSDQKIRIILGTESYLVGLESEEKKESYTFLDLKNEVCDVWNIPKEDRDVYHIVNDKFHVYSEKILVWDIQMKYLKNLFENSGNADSVNNNLITMELIHKNYILNGKNSIDIANSNNVPGKSKKEKNESNGVERIRRDTDISSTNGNFTSILEDYVLYLRQKEALTNFFKKDKLKEEILKKHEERIKHINLIFQEKKKELEKNDADDEEFRELENILELELKDENEKFNNKIIEIKNKQDPLYFSTFNIFLYRMAKFWQFAFLIMVIALILVHYSNSGSLNKPEELSLNNIMNDVLIFSSLYKNFLRNKDAFKKKDFKNLISTRKDLFMWLDILFNNLVMNVNLTDIERTNGVDAYNNYFSRSNTLYEIMGSMKFSFKNSDPAESKANSTIFDLPKEISDTLYYFEEYKIVKEDTAYKPLIISDKESQFYQDIIKIENEVCNNCFSKEKFFYNSDKNYTMLPVSGLFGDYEGGSFQYFVHPIFMTRWDFFSLIEFIKSSSYAFPQCRILKIDINVLNIYLRAIVRVSLIFEFSTIGDIQSKAEIDVLDTNLKQSSLSKLIGLLYFIIFAIFSLKIFLDLFTYKLIGDKAKKINYWPTYFEIAVLAVLIIDLFLGMEKSNLYSEIFGNILDFDTSIYEKQYAGINRWHFYEILPIINLNKLQQAIRGGIILLLFLRIIVCFLSSPLVKYIVVLFLKTTIGIFNITVFLFIFIFSFSLIFHVILGRYVESYSSLSNTFLITLTSVLGRLQVRDTQFMTTIHYFIIVAFFIIIKFIIFTFIFAIAKETFENVRKEYNDYIEKPHFKYVGENIRLFIKYLLMPVSFYFMVRDYLRIKKRYKNFGKLETFVKEDNNRKDI